MTNDIYCILLIIFFFGWIPIGACAIILKYILKSIIEFKIKYDKEE